MPINSEQRAWLNRMLRHTGADAEPAEAMVNPEGKSAPARSDLVVFLEEAQARLGLEGEIHLNEDLEVLWHRDWEPGLMDRAAEAAAAGTAGDDLTRLLEAEIRRLQAERRLLPGAVNAMLDRVREELDLTAEITVQPDGVLIWHRDWVPEIVAAGEAAATGGSRGDALRAVLRGEISRIQEERRLIPGYRPAPLGGSVGRNGKNRPQDVKAVQKALTLQAQAGLAADGKCGPQTVAAIEAYQRGIGIARPDGLIEPGGRTELALRGSPQASA